MMNSGSPMDLYNITCFECSRLITRRYSTSFSIGIRLFRKEFRDPICSIYGFVRYADEIVDTFHEHDKEDLITRFKKETYQAIRSGISINPVLHAFQQTVNRYNIDKGHIASFFRSMEMDLEKKEFNRQWYEDYIYGSAEVIGLMCLKVFCRGEESRYDRLRPTARRLGSAFQKVNFLRDMQSDFDERGRIYFPGVKLSTFSEADKRYIEEDIERDFKEALTGIRALPLEVRAGVYVAYVYYTALFNKIKSKPAYSLAQGRIRISNKRKLWLLAQALLKERLKVI